MAVGRDGLIRLLTVSEMYQADSGAIAAGVSGLQLMEAAGTAVADEIRLRWTPRPTVVLCGPGNNGGDGFVVARLLQTSGWPVTVALLSDRKTLKGDAAAMAGRWDGPTVALAPDVLPGAGLIVDALFGAGLARDLDGAARKTLQAADAMEVPIVAVDLPSGVSGDTGAVLGFAPRATLSITFVQKKPGHLLMPGRQLCGETVAVRIGMPQPVLNTIPAQLWENTPALWLADLPWPGHDAHKFHRGYVTVVSGGEDATGAARLAARGALRIGAGLVAVACPPDAFPIIAAALEAVMVKRIASPLDLSTFVGDRRRNTVLLGPGNELGQGTIDNVLAVLAHGKRCVIDASGLSAFEGKAEALFKAIQSPCVLTPHEGEFARLFGKADPGEGKLARVRRAAARSGAVVVLKGPDTVIAAPDGRAAINANAPPTLATAGSGDVLAGFVAGLLAQELDPFLAASAAVWIHGAAANTFGPGLIAEDLPGLVPGVLGMLEKLRSEAVKSAP